MQEMKVLKEVEKRRRDDSPKYSASGSNNQETYGTSTLGKSQAKATPYPEDARPNPFLSREYDPLPLRLT